MASLILPDWPLPVGVKACTTPRHGGVSAPPYDSLNLGTHVGDEVQEVARKRDLLVCRRCQSGWSKCMAPTC